MTAREQFMNLVYFDKEVVMDEFSVVDQDGLYEH